MKHPFQNSPGLFAVRDFAIVSVSRFVAAAGMAAVVVTVMLHIQGSGYGPWAVAGYLFCSALPVVVLAPWAGRLADTVDSRRLAVGASLLAAAAIAGMALTGQLPAAAQLPALYALTVLLDAAIAVALPVWQALLPRIVGQERTPRAVGTMQATMMLAQLVGPAAGGVLTGVGGPGLAFGCAAVCYLVLAAGASLVRTRRGGAAAAAKAPSPRLLDGLRTLNADALLWVLVTGSMFVVLTGEITSVVEVFLARDVLGADEAQYGLLTAMMAAGLVAGSLLAGRIGSEGTRLAAFLGSVGFTAAAIVAAGAAPTLGWLFGAAGLLGLGCGVLNACFGTLIIMRTPEARRGQVMAIVNGLMRAVSVAALVLGGLLGALAGPRAAFWISGAAALVVAAALTFVVRTRRSALLAPSEPAASEPAASGPGSGPGSGGGRQQESVADEVGGVVEQALPEARVVPVQ